MMEERFKNLRKELHLTQKEFGEKLGITNTAVSKLERKERAASDRVVRDICREFNVNETWLRFGTGEMFKKETPSPSLIRAEIENILNNMDDSELALARNILSVIEKHS